MTAHPPSLSTFSLKVYKVYKVAELKEFSLTLYRLPTLKTALLLNPLLCTVLYTDLCLVPVLSSGQLFIGEKNGFLVINLRGNFLEGPS